MPDSELGKEQLDFLQAKLKEIHPLFKLNEILNLKITIYATSIMVLL
jgi:hypothetical protein